MDPKLQPIPVGRDHSAMPNEGASLALDRKSVV